MAQSKTNNPILAVALIAIILGAGFMMFKKLRHPNTPLDEVLQAGDANAAAQWADHGIKFDELSIGEQYTPLVFAAMQGQDEIVHTFLDHGANASTPDIAGRTALMAAADNLDAKMVQDLLDHGADPNAVSKDGWSALTQAAKSATVHFDVNTKKLDADATPENLLQKREAVVKALLDKKADPNIGKFHGQPAAYLVMDSSDIVASLISAGMKLDSKDDDGRNLLCANVDKDMANKLIAAGADVNGASKGGETPLMFGTDADVAELLISHGAKVDAMDKKDQTPLFHMAMLFKPTAKKVDVLLKHGANVNVVRKGPQGPESLMEYVAKKKDALLQAQLVAHGAKVVVIAPRPKRRGGGGGGGGAAVGNL